MLRDGITQSLPAVAFARIGTVDGTTVPFDKTTAEGLLFVQSHLLRFPSWFRSRITRCSHGPSKLFDQAIDVMLFGSGLHENGGIAQPSVGTPCAAQSIRVSGAVSEPIKKRR